MAPINSPTNESNDISPFEWLTNASSLEHLLIEEDNNDDSSTHKRALHVGCGSSTVGEYLATQLDYDEVVNLDKDGTTLNQMENRWKQHVAPEHFDRMQFCQVDFLHQPIPYPEGYFDLVVDKSTLDCTLCSDEATAALLCQVYKSLNANGGRYVVVSFHHVDLLLPLLRDLPGANWQVSHHVVTRQVDAVLGNGSNVCCSTSGNDQPPTLQQPQADINGESPWATGSFQPTEGYRTTVNVMNCKRRGESIDSTLDRDAVRDFVHKTNDEWYQTRNPMLTSARQDELQKAFVDHQLDLKSSYNVLFTDAEREHLTFEHFLEDWQAFREGKSGDDEGANVECDCMSFETAVAFLKEMQ